MPTFFRLTGTSDPAFAALDLYLPPAFLRSDLCLLQLSIPLAWAAEPAYLDIPQAIKPRIVSRTPEVTQGGKSSKARELPPFARIGKHPGPKHVAQESAAKSGMGFVRMSFSYDLGVTRV